ncbi:hypothetical protein EfmAA94_27140 [Enterococcus faecium]|nr:hypothetical protein EfmAA94_27140 [Enterococcus faecium]
METLVAGYRYLADLYQIFEIKNLVEISGMSKNTILSALDELQKVKLLVKRKNGFNKSKMQMFPNFYYLLKEVVKSAF